MGTGEIGLPIREPRGSRRRPDMAPPKVERIGESQCFAAAYGDGVEWLTSTVEAAVGEEEKRSAQLSAGLRAGLEFLAASPPLAHLFLVEALASRPARLEHERTLARLAMALRPPSNELDDGGAVSEETARLLAGGLVSLLSGRVLAGEAERLPESHDLLLDYLLAPSRSAAARAAGERRAARG
jgi:hypothetical protein